jgi:hypothetical protein
VTKDGDPTPFPDAVMSTVEPAVPKSIATRDSPAADDACVQVKVMLAVVDAVAILT